MNDNIFDYYLPEYKIANNPTKNRDESKLLIYEEEKIKTDLFKNIENYIPENSIIIRNNTKVYKARLFMNRDNGKIMEVFCLKTIEKTNNSAKVESLIKNVKKLKLNEKISSQKTIDNEIIQLKATFLCRDGGNSIVEFSWNNSLVFEQILDIFGNTPLPPYIKRQSTELDNERYQTIYAEETGSVAAPTAGLHFTKEIENNLNKKNIEFANVNLHVGLGTFQPMKTENYKEHQMHKEEFSISIETIEKLASSNNKKIIAVGTTSLRSIESLYIASHFIDKNSIDKEFVIQQNDIYEIIDFLELSDSWNIIIDYMKRHNKKTINGFTSLMITPEYKCKTIDYLITNFHQPKSTLLLIVASIIGNKWKTIYEYALENDFRFLSYGDACLFKNNKQ